MLYSSPLYQKIVGHIAAALVAGPSASDAEIAALREETIKEMKGRAAATPNAIAANDAALAARKKQIEDERRGAIDELARDKLRADKERQARIDAAQADVVAARGELEAPGAGRQTEGSHHSAGNAGTGEVWRHPRHLRARRDEGGSGRYVRRATH